MIFKTITLEINQKITKFCYYIDLFIVFSQSFKIETTLKIKRTK